ncbi:hypothetical protein TUN205_06778 [Pyrenophora tritici-repentis]|nr:hypothetical protein TUN205_06778 [Pyrenophora tritici-repentis]
MASNLKSETRRAGKPTPQPRTSLQNTNCHLLLTRLWLNNPQTVSDQDPFIIHSRDNLIPGFTGPKDWTEVAREFNERLRGKMKKPLAPGTMSNRWGIARKYQDVHSDRWTRGPMDPDIDAYYNRHRPAPFYQYPDPRFNLPPIFSFLPANNPATLQLSPQLIPKKPPTSTRPLIPGSYNPSAIHSTSISSLSRIKLHLRHRTYEPVTFYFPSPDQDNLREFSQDVDANLLMAVSPDYATQARVDPEDTAFVVPAPFTARTVNIFIFFEREMGVTWIVDMVVDQLLFLFDRQCKNKAALNDIGHPVNGYVNARGRKVFLGYKLPNIDKPLPTLLVDDFWMEVLQRFVGGTKDLDVATLSFVGDLMNGLHIEVDRTWLAGTQATVQDILSRSSDDYPNVLRPVSRGHYHSHTSPRFTQHQV